MKGKTLFATALLVIGLLFPTITRAQPPFEVGVEKGMVAGKNDIGKDQERLATAGLGFLKINPSARGAGMADAFNSVANDVSSAFWNPAGITHVDKFAWTSSYMQWLVNTQIYAGALVYNTEDPRLGFLGLTLVSMIPEEVEETTIFQPTGTGRNIGASNMALGLIYAIKFTNKLSFGVKVDWVRETILDHSLNTIKFDIGTLFYTGFRNVRMAMSLKNLGRNEQYEQVKFWMPLNYYMSIADEIFGKPGEPAYLTIAAETLYAIDYDQRYHVGAELWLGNILALRGGYKFNYDAETYSIGAGLNYEIMSGRKIMLDISYTDFGNLLNTPLRVSLGGTF
jgi:hypothetical protein